MSYFEVGFVPVIYKIILIYECPWPLENTTNVNYAVTFIIYTDIRETDYVPRNEFAR